MSITLRGVAIGAGYFSQFHFDAWARIPGAEIVAVVDTDSSRALAACEGFGIPRHYGDARQAIAAERPDFVDVITRPESHPDLCRLAAEHGAHVISQKPLAPTLDDARRMVEVCAEAGVRLMVHENFRFQPWHREIKRLLGSGVIGSKLHSLTFRSRPGDGWGPDAYLSRQPFFREMPRLLLFETGVHFIDTFRYLAGEVRRVYCLARRLNPAISGEDCALAVFEFEGGAVGVWDANRYNESTADDPRYTFGEFLVEGNGGSIRLAQDGALTLQVLGRPERPHDYARERRGFSGDCVLTPNNTSSTACETAGPPRPKGMNTSKHSSCRRRSTSPPDGAPRSR